jgi:two-component system NtrC family sensor kinase
MRLSLRATQLLGYTIVVALMGTFTIFAGLSFISETVVKEAKLRVQMDLNSAWSAYNEEKALLQMVVSLIAQDELVRCGLTEKIDQKKLSGTLEELRKKYRLDFLSLVDSDQYVIAGSPSARVVKRKVRSDPVIEKAFRGGVISGTSLISREDLLLKSRELADQAYIPLVYTEREHPTERSVEDRGMALETAVPILKTDQKVCGVIYGGILLNRKHDLVDRIRKAVFDIDTYDGKPLGTVTIFLWDTRIATNVIRMDSTRAIGTRVSEEVYKTVLENGERFGDRAFVVNDWYLSAYDPIRNPDGTIIGILYVGLLEKKYLDYKAELTLKFLGVGLLALVLSVGLATYFTKRIRIPILKLVEGTRKISAGDLRTRVDEITGTLETSELSHSFNLMAESLETRSKQLEETSNRLQEAYNRADDKNRAYLEMLGFVTHELKSPLASIVFAIGSLRDHLLGTLNQAQEEVLKSSAKSADYLNSTIANFLNLSRIEEGELRLKLWKVSLRSTIVDPAMQRLSEMAADNLMKFYCEIPNNIEVTCDPNLMTSVFQNLLSNAVKYGKKDSQILIKMEGETEKEIEISVFNEGSGFNPEEAKGLFTKFTRFNAENYSTKSGTGLGLFVTKKIINKHGGNIWAESEPGRWAKFTFTIPKRVLRSSQQV